MHLPRCHVIIVSSFSTFADIYFCYHHVLPIFTSCPKQPGRGRRSSILPHLQQQQQPSWSAARRANAAARDFTVNALLYDPFQAVLFDYVGGVADAKQQLLRCIGDPGVRFTADPACLLRAVRCAARAGETY
jgi:hypothetical protein